MFARVSWLDLINSDSFYRSPTVTDPQQQSDTMSATEIESSHAGIGWKLISVDPDPVLNEISECWIPIVIVLSQFQTSRQIDPKHIFFEFACVGGLYVRVRDLSHTIRSEIVVVETPRVLFYSIFIYGILRVITQR